MASSSSILSLSSDGVSPLPPSSPSSEHPPSEPITSRDTRPRTESDDEDDEDQPASKKRKTTRTFEGDVAYKGRRLGRIFHACVNYGDLLDEGSSLKQRDPFTLSAREKRKLQLYTTLLVAYPGVKSDEQKCDERGIGTLPNLLKTGSNSARSEDIGTLKNSLPAWGIAAIPVQKKYRGYNDPICLQLLAPPNFPLDNPTVVEGIKSLRGPYALTPKLLPSFLYRDGVLATNDVYKGLFLSEILLRAGLCILRGHDASMEGKPGKNSGKSIAERHKIKTITPAFIAYVAMLVRFSLSSQTQWGTTESSGWKYNQFFKQLLNLLEVQMTSVNLGKIVWEWKSRIFEDCEDSDDDDDDEPDASSSGTSLIPDLRQMVVEQANREKEREAEDRRRAEAEARRQVDAANRALRDATNGNLNRR